MNITKDYKLHVDVTSVPTGEQHLRISSTWPGAKDPQEKRTLFQATLTPTKMNELAREILDGSERVGLE